MTLAEQALANRKNKQEVKTNTQATTDEKEKAKVPAKQKSKTVAKKQPSPISVFRDALEKTTSEFLKLMDEEEATRFKREVMTVVRSNKNILALEPRSIIKCAVEAAQLRLSLDVNLGQAYLVPFKGVATLQIGYQGYLELARRSGQIKDIRAEVVWEGDDFYQKTTQNGIEFEHIPCTPSQRGERVGVYMLAQLTNGGIHYGFMFSEEVAFVRSLSKDNRQSSIWNVHTDAMWKKTVIKRESKFLPMSSQDMRSLASVSGEDGIYDVEVEEVPHDKETGEIDSKVA